MSDVNERYVQNVSLAEARRVHALEKAIESHDYPTTDVEILGRAKAFEEYLKGGGDA
ncbi:hypothetical protein ACFY7C_19240 [Streptomyces sp. NPDC012769]|uniref:hypothetical protein n=1 Tax=Streptomyces sp. NPDC012769 TaxID=3364848 RepID=UPI0036B06C2F